VRTAIVATLCLLLSTALVAQSLQEKQRDLQRMRASIEATRQRIESLNNRESSTMRSLSSYQRQSSRLGMYIASLERDLRALQDSASVVEREMQNTQSSLQRAEGSYNAITRAMIDLQAKEAGVPHASSERTEVYRSLSASLSMYRKQMISLQDSLADQRMLLQEYSQTQSSVIAAKEREKERLASTITKSRTEIERIRADKNLLRKELAKKQASVATLRSMISDLVSREERKRRAENNQKKSQQRSEPRIADSRPTDKREPQISTGGDVAGGYEGNSLPWPTVSRQLLHGYGAYRSPVTGTTFENPGIDIKTPVGSNVVCVGNGEVSSVSWLPGFGSLVIVDHRNGFRTVYANMTSVTVRQGSSVRAGSLLGTSGESVDGAFVHFEVWRGRDRSNPLTYLR